SPHACGRWQVCGDDAGASGDADWADVPAAYGYWRSGILDTRRAGALLQPAFPADGIALEIRAGDVSPRAAGLVQSAGGRSQSAAMLRHQKAISSLPASPTFLTNAVDQ